MALFIYRAVGVEIGTARKTFRSFIRRKAGHFMYLGSFQNEVLSSSGTMRVRLRSLATATMSHICAITTGGAPIESMLLRI